MGYVVGFSKPGWDRPYYLSRFVKDGDGFRPLGVLPRVGFTLQDIFFISRSDCPILPSFRIAWFIAQNMRRAGYQAEVQYVK